MTVGEGIPGGQTTTPAPSPPSASSPARGLCTAMRPVPLPFGHRVSADATRPLELARTTLHDLALCTVASPLGGPFTVDEPAEDWLLVGVLAGRLALQRDGGGAPTVLACGEARLVDGAALRGGTLDAATRLVSLTLAPSVLRRFLADALDAPVVERIAFRDEPLGRDLSALVCGLCTSWIDGAAPDGGQPGRERVGQALRQALLAALLHGTDHGYGERLAGRARPSVLPGLVKRATAHMQAHLGSAALDVEALAGAAGVSVRTLQLNFKRLHGCSPMQHLRTLRLQAVRQALLQAGDGASVAEIAARHGFTHLGGFAAHYRAAFGELPRQTLARAPRSAEPCAAGPGAADQRA
ncbi:hypothetical protein ISF6_4664 [Piscinibacter sakaiensis]|uniref:HTH araC/xylS-type domain-containing protein n=1 Tax=Piscinibacter sakaiensis TaxID=1547922 RepID=A0A0K8NW26_PISS1|nr:hypothetical protein ISF6_4664 [Piscinibacter sakaiensis]